MRRTIRRRRNLLAGFILFALTVLLLLDCRDALSGLWYCQFPRTSTSSAPSIHLVLAAATWNDLSWTKEIEIPNLLPIPYIANDPTAEYHPPVNRGNEAMVYLTYLHEFYDRLPDISIFTHGSDSSWHVDGVLGYSTAYAISNLDLDELRRRQYMNLRISWLRACPNWINTTVTSIWSEGYDEKLRPEERFMKRAFMENFPDDPVPPILSQPCCSQFAVTREAIRSVPRKQYKRQMEWLKSTRLESDLSGRVWEHMWQWLFTKKAIDCPMEHKALCRAYHICFEDAEDWAKWQELETERFDIFLHRNAMLQNGIQPDNEAVVKLDEQIQAYEEDLQPWRLRAIERGESRARRMEIAGDL